MISHSKNNQPDPEVQVLLGQVAEKMSAGRTREAEQLCQSVLARQEGQPDALLALAQIALSGNDRASATTYLHTAIQANPELAEPHYRLGVLQNAEGQSDAAAVSFARVVEIEPDKARGWLKLGSARLAKGDAGSAAEAFQQALFLEPRLRSAEKDTRLLESIRNEIRNANAVLRKHYREMADQTLTRTRERYPGADLRRFEEAFRILQGDQPRRYCHPMQKPAFLLFPDMPARAWFEREEFEWVRRVEDAAPRIRSELDGLLAERAGFRPYIQGVSSDHGAISYSGEDFSSLANSQAWNSFHLNNAGVIKDNADRCPETMAVMDSLPLAQARDYMPEIFFSVLQPGAHIIPHFGQMNIRLTVHLGLIIPDNCGLRAGEETRQWQEGRVLAFDDTFEHEAWNRGASDRVVLIFETWNPDLSEAEIGGLQDFFETRGEWMSRFQKPVAAQVEA